MKIAYKRCSTNESKQDVARQLFGLEFDKTFIEYASGKNEKDRPVFQECLDSLLEGDEIYFQDLSRAGRSSVELQLTVKKLIDRGVKVVFVSEGLTFVGEGGDPMAQAVSKLMLQMLAAVNELFLTQTSVAVKQGQKRARAEGKKIGGASPEWKKSYQANKANHKSTRSNEASKLKQQPVLNEIKKMISYSGNTLTLDQISDNLNKGGYTTARGSSFSKGAVSRLISANNIERKRLNKYETGRV
jgi:DNA invertase Pin-like site-specific DNA recombinase